MAHKIINEIMKEFILSLFRKFIRNDSAIVSSSNSENTWVCFNDADVEMYIIERLALLNKLLAVHNIPNFPKDPYIKAVKELMRDKTHFLQSTRASFLIEHPAFISYLERFGLTDEEIGYCCLYAIGHKGKDISAYIGNSHYKMSSEIRQKLGLREKDTNISIYLQDIFAKMSK